MNAWIKLTFLGMAGGLILFVVISVAFGLGFGVEFEGEGETITYVDHPPITFDDALMAIGEGQVTEVVVYDSLNPIDENWYEYDSGRGLVRWQAEGLEVFVTSTSDMEERAVFVPGSDIIGLESESFQELLDLVEEVNRTSSAKIEISDYRPER